MTAPVRAALYLRVSTGRQADNDLSIPDQRRQAKGYCASRGWEIVADYVEPGASATDDRRPEFQRMIDAATTKPPAFDVILVHSFSRFFRDQFQLEFYVRRLAKNGVRLVSITQELGDDPMSNMIRQIMALFDEYQSRENAKHTLRAMKENARQGFWNGALPPIGYRIVEAAEQRGHRTKKTLEIDPIPGRNRAADLPPGTRGKRLLGTDGRQIDCQTSERIRHPHARRRTLGCRCRAQDTHANDVYRPPPLQHQALENARAKARGRGGRDDCAADHRHSRLRDRANAAQDTRPGADRAALSASSSFSRGRGVDAVLITAATTSNTPIQQAADICRKRGRIVLVGVAGLQLSRDVFYQKELSFQVSCSYGPGRYDKDYEEKGHDYPIGYVRWTEQRNFEAVLDMLADGRLSVSALVSHRYPLDRTSDAYGVVSGKESSLGILLKYPSATHLESASLDPPRTIAMGSVRSRSLGTVPVIGVIGSGSYAMQTLLPAFAKQRVHLKTIASRDGANVTQAARRFSFSQASTDIDSMLEDAEIDAVVIVTRHDTHASLVCRALRAGKHVFVEKPLALCEAEVETVEATYLGQYSQGRAPVLMVGFNRRFAPQVKKMKELLDQMIEPKAIVLTINAGAVPADHWTQDVKVGGGRIVGEGCHFVDLLRHLVGSEISGVQAARIEHGAFAGSGDTLTFTLRFVDGSIGTVHYFANGHKGIAKERVEVFCGGRILQLDNFRRLRGYGWNGFSQNEPVATGQGTRSGGGAVRSQRSWRPGVTYPA